MGQSSVMAGKPYPGTYVDRDDEVRPNTEQVRVSLRSQCGWRDDAEQVLFSAWETQTSSVRVCVVFLESAHPN